MAVSKKVRYEILRRDNFACRYCGAFGPMTVLVVDHVVPRKVGGTDKPQNLITACQDCNSGKAASMPPAFLVSEVEQIAREWADEPRSEPDEDDIFAMYIYQESLCQLEALTGPEVLHWIARTCAAALPYRPTHEQLIRAAGDMARRHGQERQSEVTS